MQPGNLQQQVQFAWQHINTAVAIGHSKPVSRTAHQHSRDQHRQSKGIGPDLIVSGSGRVQLPVKLGHVGVSFSKA